MNGFLRGSLLVALVSMAGCTAKKAPEDTSPTPEEGQAPPTAVEKPDSDEAPEESGGDGAAAEGAAPMRGAEPAAAPPPAPGGASEVGGGQKKEKSRKGAPRTRGGNSVGDEGYSMDEEEENPGATEP